MMSNKSIRRQLAAVALSFAAAVIATSVAADELGRGTSVDNWKGFGVLKGGKGYVETPMGQLHYRDIGPRDDPYPIVLFHQSPMSMIQWGEIQNFLAGMGSRVVTLDTPGYGMSDPPPKQPTIREFADNIIYLLDALQLDRVVVGGHHTGAHIAMSFAANHGDRVVGLVLHGAAMMNREEAKAFLSREEKSRTPVPDGSHLSRTFNPARTQYKGRLEMDTWKVIGSFMQGPDIGHFAAFHNDMSLDVPKVKVPTILLTDRSDPTSVMDQRLADLRPDFELVEFSKGDEPRIMAAPKRWATMIADWKAENIK